MRSTTWRRLRRQQAGAVDAQMDGGLGCVALIAIIAAILFPVFAQSRDQARMASAESNLKQVGLAELMYAQDHGDHYPPMDTMAHFEDAIRPYEKGNDIDALLRDPGTGTPFALRTNMSGVGLATIASPATTVLAIDPVPHGGMIATLYADGHVKGVPAAP